MEVWQALAASPVLLAAIPLARRIFDWWAADRAQRSLHTAQQVYQELNTAQYRLNCDRIMIISAHNCGGPLKPDVLMYVDALYEVIADLEPRLARIVNVRVDSYLVELLSSIIKEGVIWRRKDQVPQGSYVWNLYETDGVKQACCFLIRTEDKRVLYGVVHFKSDFVSPTPQQQDAIATLRSTLGNLLN